MNVFHHAVENSSGLVDLLLNGYTVKPSLDLGCRPKGYASLTAGYLARLRWLRQLRLLTASKS